MWDEPSGGSLRAAGPRSPRSGYVWIEALRLVASTAGSLAIAAVAVATVAASLTFASSLNHLVASPRAQGWNWDVLVGNPNDESDHEQQTASLLAHDRYVHGYSAIALLASANQGTAVIDGPPSGSDRARSSQGFGAPDLVAGHSAGARSDRAR